MGRSLGHSLAEVLVSALRRLEARGALGICLYRGFLCELLLLLNSSTKIEALQAEALLPHVLSCQDSG